MSIDEIVRAWKADDEDDQENQDEKAPENPAGEELSDEELNQVAGGLECDACSCDSEGGTQRERLL